MSPITATQAVARRDYLGASDMAAVCGLDPYKSAADVYAEKCFDLEDASSEAIDIGNDFEAPLLYWAARKLGVEIRRNQRRVHPTDKLIAASLDAVVVGEPWAIEAKTTSSPAEYGEEGTDQVPEKVIVQCQAQCYVAGLAVVYVPVLMARYDRLHRALYRVERNEDLIAAIVDRGRAFWRDHVEARTPPLDCAPSMDVLKRIRRQPESSIDVEASLVLGWKVARDARLLAEKEEGKAKAQLILAAGDAELIRWGDPERELTYLEHTRPAHAVQSSTFRTLRERKSS